jgi:hypothetical protein
MIDEQKDDKHSVRPNSGNTIVSGSACPGFLLDAVNELETYRTPQKIVDYIEAERMKVIIGNPPYEVT